MHNKDWEQLLERYYAGETTLAEEQYIRQRLLAETEPTPDGQLAKFFAEQQALTLPAATTRSIQQKIRASRAKRSRLYTLYAVAASLLLLLSVWFWSSPVDATVHPVAQAVDWSKYEVADPEEAAAILMGSLQSVSDNFKAGKKALSNVNQASVLGRPLDN
ncbi:MAG: hypothetical protein AAF828_00085 [Bacteroidota bacterium]